MLEGAYSNMDTIADYGAKRTLNIGGSVRGYIETGNAYDKHYYKKDEEKADSFEKSDKKAKAAKTAVGIAAVGAAIAGAVALVKTGKYKAVVDFVKENAPKVTGALSKAKDYVVKKAAPLNDALAKKIDSLKNFKFKKPEIKLPKFKMPEFFKKVK